VKKIKTIYYFYPSLIVFLTLISMFLNVEIFRSPLQTFSAWFVLSVLTFTVGWAIDKFFGWVYGGKVIFVTIIISVLFSLGFAVFFGEYFYISNPFLEDLLFYGLRGILLGSMAFFGMAVSETVRRETLCEIYDSIEKETELKLKNAEEKASLIIEKAELEAEKILSEAKSNVGILNRQYEELMLKIETLINTEKNILKKYEENNSNEIKD